MELKPRNRVEKKKKLPKLKRKTVAKRKTHKTKTIVVAENADTQIALLQHQ